jgi:hypothetical protein
MRMSYMIAVSPRVENYSSRVSSITENFSGTHSRNLGIRIMRVLGLEVSPCRSHFSPSLDQDVGLRRGSPVPFVSQASFVIGQRVRGEFSYERLKCLLHSRVHSLGHDKIDHRCLTAYALSDSENVDVNGSEQWRALPLGERLIFVGRPEYRILFNCSPTFYRICWDIVSLGNTASVGVRGYQYA